MTETRRGLRHAGVHGPRGVPWRAGRRAQPIYTPWGPSSTSCSPGGRYFGASRPPTRFLAQLKQAPAPPSAHILAREAHADLDAVVLRCLAKIKASDSRAPPRWRRRSVRGVSPGSASRRRERDAPPQGAQLRAGGAGESRAWRGGARDEAPVSAGAPPNPCPANTSELEERRRALMRVASIAACIAWPFFIVTDVMATSISPSSSALLTFFGLRVAGLLATAVLIAFVRQSGISARALARCDVLGFTSFAFLVFSRSGTPPGFRGTSRPRNRGG